MYYPCLNHRSFAPSAKTSLCPKQTSPLTTELPNEQRQVIRHQNNPAMKPFPTATAITAKSLSTVHIRRTHGTSVLQAAANANANAKLHAFRQVVHARKSTKKFEPDRIVPDGIWRDILGMTLVRDFIFIYFQCMRRCHEKLYTSSLEQHKRRHHHLGSTSNQRTSFFSGPPPSNQHYPNTPCSALGINTEP